MSILLDAVTVYYLVEVESMLGQEFQTRRLNGEDLIDGSEGARAEVDVVGFASVDGGARGLLACGLNEEKGEAKLEWRELSN